MQIQRPQSRKSIPKNAEKVFEGLFFDTYQWEQELFDGSTTTYEAVERKQDSVNVIPVTKEGKIVLGKQSQSEMNDFLGCLGGKIDPGENPLEAAKRELREESGYVAENFELLGTFHAEIIEWATYTFVATGLEKVSELELESGEKIELLEVSFDEYMEIIKRDDYRDFDVALLLLKDEGVREKLRSYSS